MSAAYTFKWPKGPEEVILTGTFDNWSKSLYLVKQADGSFELTVPLPSDSDRILYKYIVDGEWLVSPTQKITQDENGNANNVLEVSDLVSLASSAGVRIPESGGLFSKAVDKDELKTTVLPSTEGVQTSLTGEPGIYIPKDPEALAAFKEVRDVEPKTANEQPELTATEKKQQKKKVKRSQYKAKKKKRASEIAAAASATETSELDTDAQSPEPESNDVSIRDIDSSAKEVENGIQKSNEVVETIAVSGVTSVDAAGVSSTAVEAVAVSSEPVEEPISEVKESVTGPEAVEPADKTIEPAEESVKEPESVTNGNIVSISKPKEESVKESVTTAPIVEQTTTEAKVIITEPVDNEEDVPSTLDPKAKAAVVSEPAKQESVPEKEVDASPITKTEESKPKPSTNYESEEEIVIAQGNHEDLAAAIAAQEGDVIVEEIKPTESEAARLTEEANLPKQSASTGALSNKPVVKETVSSKKDKKNKKPSALGRFIKKIFK